MVFLLVVVTTTLEISYRFQWIDFYSNDISSLSDEDSEKPNVLIFGDSFGAQKNSYVDELRKQFPKVDFINSSVPGTCAIQAEYMARRRLKKYKPKLVVFQMYVGNDLLDVEHPINWEVLDWKRNLYWWLADRIHVMGFFNYRMAQLSQQIAQDELEGADGKTDEAFLPDRYSPRTRLYLEANPQYLQQSILLQNGVRKAMDKLLLAYESVIDQLDSETEFAFLIIPHCTQVAEKYETRFSEMGAVFSENVISNRYPFLEAMELKFGRDKILNPITALLQREKDGNDCYFPNDPHMTAAGHSALAETVSKQLAAFLEL